MCRRDSAKAAVDLDPGLTVSGSGLLPDGQDFPAAATEAEKGYPAAPAVSQCLARPAAVRGLAQGTAWGLGQWLGMDSLQVTALD